MDSVKKEAVEQLRPNKALKDMSKFYKEQERIIQANKEWKVHCIMYKHVLKGMERVSVI